jgi:hypothetical protein
MISGCLIHTARIKIRCKGRIHHDNLANAHIYVLIDAGEQGKCSASLPSGGSLTLTSDDGPAGGRPE